jgi:hypothetical protein
VLASTTTDATSVRFRSPPLGGPGIRDVQKDRAGPVSLPAKKERFEREGQAIYGTMAYYSRRVDSGDIQEQESQA